MYLTMCVGINLGKVWNIDTFQFLTTLSSHNHWVYSMCVFNNHLFAGSHNMVKVKKKGGEK